MMHPTRNDLPEPTREKAAALLNALLADLIDLAAQVKHAHWNVKGPHFIALHELFDDIAAALLPHIDAAAERCTALGGVAEGDLRTVAKRSRLAPYPAGLTAGPDHVAALANAIAAAAKTTRAAIDTAAEFGDAGTADLFTQVSRELDQRLWFLEAHLEA